MSSWDDGSQTTPFAKLPFQDPAATIMWRNNSPFRPGIHLFWEMTNWSSKYFVFDIWHFPMRPNLTTQWTGDKDASFFRDRQYCFWRARHNHKHVLAENRAVTIRSQETWVGVYEHTTLSILIFWLTAFQIFTVSGNSLIEMVPFLWTFSHKFIPICLDNTVDQWTV